MNKRLEYQAKSNYRYKPECNRSVDSIVWLRSLNQDSITLKFLIAEDGNPQIENVFLGGIYNKKHPTYIWCSVDNYIHVVIRQGGYSYDFHYAEQFSKFCKWNPYLSDLKRRTKLLRQSKCRRLKSETKLLIQDTFKNKNFKQCNTCITMLN